MRAPQGKRGGTKRRCYSLARWAVLLAVAGATQGGASRQGGARRSMVAELGQQLASIGLGGSTQQQQQQQLCSIYVLDASEELAPLVGAPRCNITDTRLWPHDQPGRGIDGLDHTPHWASQHATVYWLAKAIRGSPYATRDLASADLVFVDSHCYYVRLSARHGDDAEAADAVKKHARAALLGALQRLPRFAASDHGRGFVVGLPHPAFIDLFNTTCKGLRNAYLLPAEGSWRVFCSDRNKAREGRSLVVPYSAVTHIPERVEGQQRPIFLFSRGCCPEPGSVCAHKVVDPRRNSAGKLMRLALLRALRGTSPDIEVDCSCGICDAEIRIDHATMMQKLASARFCPVIAGDTQSSRRLSEVVLAGCIPVFVGPPFHTLPLPADVDYASFSVFANMTNTSAWIFRPPYPEGRLMKSNTPIVLDMWRLEVEVPPQRMLQAATFAELVAHLRAITPEALARMQAALAQERGKFMYAPPGSSRGEGGGGTPLTHIVIRRLCEHARWLRSGAPAGAEAPAGAGP